MYLNNNSKSWQIKQRQEQLQKIANSFSEVDGQEYSVSLTIKETTPPNQLNFTFEEKTECNCTPKNNY